MSPPPKNPTAKTSVKSALPARAKGVSAQEFRKTNDAIGFRLKEGRLTFLMRRLFNVLMFHAQTLKDVGKNPPIDTPTAKKYFWVPLSDVARDARYDSRDMQFLRTQLNEMQSVKLILEDDRRWTSETLFSSLTFVNPAGLQNKHAGQIWLGFAFPPEVHELVMSPDQYTRMSLIYQGAFRSAAGLALYEVCRRYLGNPSKVTYTKDYQAWFEILTSNPAGSEAPPYKYFKRDTLKPAMAEINTITDIEVELIEHKAGRRIVGLQFRVHANTQGKLEFPAPPTIDTDLIDKISSLGFSPNEAADLVATNNDARLREVLSIVQARMQSKASAQLESPAAYFRWALRQGITPAREIANDSEAGQTGARRPSKPSTRHTADGEDVMARFLTARAAQAMMIYKEMGLSEREDVITRFRASGKSSRLKIDEALSQPMTRAIFARWYAQDLWGDPTTQALAQFVEQTVLTTSATPLP